MKSIMDTFLEIAEQLEKEQNNFGWYQDSFCDISQTKLIAEIENFAELNSSTIKLLIVKFLILIIPRKEQLIIIG